MALMIFIKFKYAHKRPLISLDIQIQKKSSSGFGDIQENMTGYHDEHLLANKDGAPRPSWPPSCAVPRPASAWPDRSADRAIRSGTAQRRERPHRPFAPSRPATAGH